MADHLLLAFAKFFQAEFAQGALQINLPNSGHKRIILPSCRKNVDPVFFGFIKPSALSELVFCVSVGAKASADRVFNNNGYSLDTNVRQTFIRPNPDF